MHMHEERARPCSCACGNNYYRNTVVLRATTKTSLTVLYCTLLKCTVRYCTVIYCTVLYSTVLYIILLLSMTKFTHQIFLFKFKP